MRAMKKKVGIEREKKENETSGDDARGGRDREREEGQVEKGSECLKSIEAGGWLRERKIVKSRGWPGILDEGISTEIWILDSMDRRLSRRGGIWTAHRRQGGSRRDAETEEWRIEGAVESFSERIKARARSISAPRVTKE